MLGHSHFKRISLAVARFLGGGGDLSLQQYFFNVACFLGGIFGLLSFAGNFFTAVPVAASLLSLAYTLVLTVFFIISRLKQIYQPLVWPLLLASLCALDPVWFMVGGAEGSTTIVFTALVFFFSLITKGKTRIVMICAIIINVIVLILMEKFNPGLVVAYQNADMARIDIFVTFFYTAVVIAVCLSIIFRAYEHERMRVEQEKNLLHSRNFQIEKDLQLARRLQSGQIPEKSPYSWVSFDYLPMDQVGGDFFDFIHFRNRDQFGILISDVSGHGVAAAFITSIIKASILQSRPILEDPAEFLAQLNEILVPLAGAHFATVFYAVYHRGMKLLTYCNAGHCMPFALNGENVLQLDPDGSSMPLGVLPVKELQAMGKPLQNRQVNLHVNTRLLFYTDGLTETRPLAGGPEFGEKELPEILRLSENMSPAKLITTIREKLIIYRGSRQIDDDVCLICMDSNEGVKR